jgi:hypothetical protein
MTGSSRRRPRPERVDKTGVGPEDATRSARRSDDDAQVPVDPLDPNIGKRMSVSGILIGPGAATGSTSPRSAGSPMRATEVRAGRTWSGPPV